MTHYTTTTPYTYRTIFGEFVCEKQLADFILAIWATTSFFSSYEQWLCGRVHVVINNFGDFNIGEFSEKSPIANINSLPINRLVRYVHTHYSDMSWLVYCALPVTIWYIFELYHLSPINDTSKTNYKMAVLRYIKLWPLKMAAACQEI